MSLPPLVTTDTASPERSDAAPAEAPAPQRYECDHCGRPFEGQPGGAGLLIWTRGEEVRYEEPPLCEECALKVSIGALFQWQVEDEEG